MSESKRKIFTGAQKAKIALEAVRGAKTINHPTQVSQWKNDLVDNAGSLFEGKRRSDRKTQFQYKKWDSAIQLECERGSILN